MDPGKPEKLNRGESYLWLSNDTGLSWRRTAEKARRIAISADGTRAVITGKKSVRVSVHDGGLPARDAAAADGTLFSGWSSRPCPTERAGQLEDLTASADLRRIAVTSYAIRGFVYRSDDFGVTWRVLSSTPNYVTALSEELLPRQYLQRIAMDGRGKKMLVTGLTRACDVRSRTTFHVAPLSVER